MKKICIILIMALCLLVVVLPVIAAADGQGSRSDTTGQTDRNNGQYIGEGNSSDGADSSPGNDGLSRGERNGSGGTDRTGTSGTPPGELSRGDRQNETRGNGNTPADLLNNESQIPGLKNRSSGDRGDLRNSTITLPPGWVRNPNQVRDTVQSLLAMENRTGGIGPQVSAIAREFNNSAEAGRQYEDRIINRDPFSRFFFGGDRQAATELENLTVQNQARITEIETLLDSSEMDADTRSQIEGELLVLRQNLAYDQQLAAQAQQEHGLFG